MMRTGLEMGDLRWEFGSESGIRTPGSDPVLWKSGLAAFRRLHGGHRLRNAVEHRIEPGAIHVPTAHHHRVNPSRGADVVQRIRVKDHQARRAACAEPSVPRL